jgi:hypothetical protein
MRLIGQLALLLGTAVVVALSLSDPSFAQIGGRLTGAPAPLIGIGLPVAGLVVGAIWLVRRAKN